MNCHIGFVPNVLSQRVERETPNPLDVDLIVLAPLSLACQLENIISVRSGVKVISSEDISFEYSCK